MAIAVSFRYRCNLPMYYYIDAHQFTEGEHTSLIKHAPLDKLAGTSVGRYYLEQFMGQSKLCTQLSCTRLLEMTTYLLRFLEGPMYATPKEREAYLEHFHYRAGQIAALKHPYILPLSTLGSFVDCHIWSRHTSRYVPYVHVSTKMAYSIPLQLVVTWIRSQRLWNMLMSMESSMAVFPWTLFSSGLMVNWW